VLCISAILCFVYVFVCFYCSRPIFCNRRVSNHLASVDVSAGNSLSTPQYYDRTFVIFSIIIAALCNRGPLYFSPVICIFYLSIYLLLFLFLA